MAFGFNRSDHKPSYKGAPTWLHPLTGETRGLEVLLENTRDFTITQEEEAYDPVNDAGRAVPGSGVVKAVKIEAKFLSSDEKVRQLFTGTGDQSVKGKYYGITTLLADYIDNAGTTKTGYYTFYKARIVQAGTFAVGTNEHGYMFTAICYANETCAAYTATLPTGACFKPTAVSASIAAGEYYATADGAIA